MTVNEIAKILIHNFVSCDAEYIDDKDGYIDVAVVFKDTPEIREVMGDYVIHETDTVWIWAIFNDSKDLNSPYKLMDMDTYKDIPYDSNLRQALSSCFGKRITSARRRFIKELEKGEN